MINKEFQVHKLNEEGFKKAQEVAILFNSLLENLWVLVRENEGREFCIVRNKLEEACFYAKKAIANDSINQLQLGENNEQK